MKMKGKKGKREQGFILNDSIQFHSIQFSSVQFHSTQFSLQNFTSLQSTSIQPTYSHTVIHYRPQRPQRRPQVLSPQSLQSFPLPPQSHSLQGSVTTNQTPKIRYCNNKQLPTCMQTPRRVKKIRFDYSTYLFFWLLAASAERCRRSQKIGFRFRLFNYCMYLLGILQYCTRRFVLVRFLLFVSSSSSFLLLSTPKVSKVVL